MENENYFFCSKSMIDFVKPAKISKQFKSGFYKDDNLYYVAVLNFDEVQAKYNQLSEDEQSDIMCRECVGGTMDVSSITLSGCRKNGLLFEISTKIGLTSEKNQAMTIKNLSERFNCTPIEFINKIA